MQLLELLADLEGDSFNITENELLEVFAQMENELKFPLEDNTKVSFYPARIKR